MKIILFLIFAAFLLTSCSNPDTSGGVTLSRGAKGDRGGDDTNEFPDGSCDGGRRNPPSYDQGCGWVHHGSENRYYIKPKADLSFAILNFADLRGANLRTANLRNADLDDAGLSGADLSGARLRGADLRGVKANSRTICPNGIRWLTAGNDCGFR